MRLYIEAVACSRFSIPKRSNQQGVLQEDVWVKLRRYLDVLVRNRGGSPFYAFQRIQQGVSKKLHVDICCRGGYILSQGGGGGRGSPFYAFQHVRQ